MVFRNTFRIKAIFERIETLLYGIIYRNLRLKFVFCPMWYTSKKQFVAPFIFSFITGFFSYAQDFSGRWTAHYSYKETTDITASDVSVYTASGNAIVKYTIASGENQTITTVNGLSGDDISTVLYSKEKELLFIGYENGLIEIFDERTNDITSLVDIPNRAIIPEAERRINHFFEFDNLIYVSTNFGISELDTERLEFGDSFFVGPNNTRIPIAQLGVLDNFIYAASPSNGMLRADRNATDLIDSNRWQVIDTSGFLGVQIVENKILGISVNNAIEEFDGTQFVNRRGFSQTIVNSKVNQDRLIITTTGQTFVINTSDFSTQFTGAVDTQALSSSILVGDQVFIGTESSGIFEINSSTSDELENITPSGPEFNDGFKIQSAPNQEMWLFYGKYSLNYNPFFPRLLQRPINILNSDGKWEIIPLSDLDNTSSLIDVSFDPNEPGRAFVSSFQEGVLELKDRKLVQKYTDVSSDLDFGFGVEGVVRINETFVDSRGSLWLTIAATERALQQYEISDGQFQAATKVNLQETNSLNGFSNIVEDGQGNIYSGGLLSGLYAYNPKTEQVVNIDAVGSGDSGEDDVRTLIIDKNDQIWIGLQSGLRVINQAASVFENPNLDWQTIIIQEGSGPAQGLLFDQFIKDIEVDGANNKWIATTSGLFYVSEDGQETLAQFDRNNSPLPTNDILDLSINEKNGAVFIVTGKGVLEYQGFATEANTTLADLRAFPNPVRPGFSRNVTIDGLTEGANIKITDIEGNLVFEEFSQGGSVQWDTTAFGRHKVASGVYLILVTAEDQAETKVSKLMIIR